MTTTDTQPRRWTLTGDAGMRAQTLIHLQTLPHVRVNVEQYVEKLVIVSPDNNFKVREIMQGRGATEGRV